MEVLPISLIKSMAQTGTNMIDGSTLKILLLLLMQQKPQE